MTGASGYIGRNLLQRLAPFADVIALSRGGGKGREPEPHTSWRACDLFSLIDAEKGLAGADFAIYLVHSMLPSAKLTQARFEDMDVLLADHFARAASKNGVRQIVYLSGIIPPDVPPRELSRHLRSRLEVEKVLASYGVPVTTLRAGLIVGPEGSSFPILLKLVRRLPFMILPRWTRTRTHAIALPEVLDALTAAIGRTDLYRRAIDIGGPDVLTYKQMLRQTAEALGKKRLFIPFPAFSVYLSRLWLALVTGTPKEMAYPLIESLIHPMVARKEGSASGIGEGAITFRQAAEDAIREEGERKRSRNGAGSAQKRKSEKNARDAVSDVRSVQRVRLPAGMDAHAASKSYLHWLNRAAGPLIRVAHDKKDIYRIRVAGRKAPLLELTYSEERSSPTRALYYITGGSFSSRKETHRGRLEFLQVPDSDECIIAIHDYLPALPWFLYKYTQAKIHLWVMHAFRRYLRKRIR
ncbi:NAD-dependent epimerase/dehydratase family protein [Cohnella rhizosphaerae]|uniref:NmrA family protein n=1 Tax=Cohnella rhizosphaerae TaxID=1457232 RepID=A0A9X4KQK9_9BACL|nr:NAD-dependent epimerase/dehydratase family protein [Cohnella rhizosphaerae]MDG0808982.1 NmrA family protein [Cohnella rhizosphaerae]